MEFKREEEVKVPVNLKVGKVEIALEVSPYAEIERRADFRLYKEYLTLLSEADSLNRLREKLGEAEFNDQISVIDNEIEEIELKALEMETSLIRIRQKYSDRGYLEELLKEMVSKNIDFEIFMETLSFRELENFVKQFKADILKELEGKSKS